MTCNGYELELVGLGTEPKRMVAIVLFDCGTKTRMAAVRIDPVPVRTGSGSQTVRFNPIRRHTHFKENKKYEKI